MFSLNRSLSLGSDNPLQIGILSTRRIGSGNRKWLGHELYNT